MGPKRISFPTSFIWESVGLEFSSDPLKRKEVSIGNSWMQKPSFKGESVREGADGCHRNVRQRYPN